ncbi:MAG: hypothetical protein J3Q66DRAFT_393118 [Benniella sp.]|nr:MAG: hypothetical protein J3Q66DRAFT_393118 [Benniella sp.]
MSTQHAISFLICFFPFTPFSLFSSSSSSTCKPPLHQKELAHAVIVLLYSAALGTPRAFGDGDPNKGIWFLGHIEWLLLVKDIHLFLKRLCAACDLPSVLTLVDH